MKKTISEKKKNVGEFELELKVINSGLDELEEKKNQLASAKQQEKNISKETTKLSGSIQSLQRSLEELNTRQKLFSEGSDKEAICPVCRQKIEEDQIENLQEHYRKEIKELKSNLQDFQSELNTKKDSLSTLEKDINELEVQIEALPKKKTACKRL